MKRELEFYLCRLYLRPGGFWLSFGEVVNFDNGNTWAALAFGYNKDDGFRLEVLTAEPDKATEKLPPVTFNKN